MNNRVDIMIWFGLNATNIQPLHATIFQCTPLLQRTIYTQRASLNLTDQRKGGVI